MEVIKIFKVTELKMKKLDYKTAKKFIETYHYSKSCPKISLAARREGFGFIGIEREPEYVEIAEARAGEIDTVPESCRQLTLF